MTFFVVVLLCLTIVPSTFSVETIHTFLTAVEINQIFNSDVVPEKYEVVEVKMSQNRRHKRELRVGSELSMRAFGRKINLWLNPRNSLLAGTDTPVYDALYSPSLPGNVRYKLRRGMMEKLGKVFENPRKKASLVIGWEQEKRKPRINGFIGSEKLVVRSMPKRVATEHRRRHREAGVVTNLDSAYHFVFKAPVNEEEIKLPALNETSFRRDQPKMNGTGIPSTIYPEILVVVDHSIRKLYGDQSYGLLEYVLAYWNGVDLKYRSLTNPNIRIHISGIILARHPGATPYIWANRLSGDVTHPTDALESASKFYYTVKNTFPLDSYDISVTMTKFALGHPGSRGQRILGLSYVIDACFRDPAFEVTRGIALVYDDNAFTGVFVTAHELGHLIGAGHDLRIDCPYEYGFLMSWTPVFTKNSSDFSSCSRKHIDTHLKNRQLDCLFNQPKVGKSVPRLLPGKMRSLQLQCESHGFEAPCLIDNPYICVNVHCLNEAGECHEIRTNALDGTRCGANKFCLHSECVKIPTRKSDRLKKPPRTQFNFFNYDSRHGNNRWSSTTSRSISLDEYYGYDTNADTKRRNPMRTRPPSVIFVNRPHRGRQ